MLYTLVAENVRDYAIFLLDTDGIIRCWGESGAADEVVDEGGG